MNLLHTKQLPRTSGLGNYFVCKRFGIQTLTGICDPNKSRARHHHRFSDVFKGYKRDHWYERWVNW